MEIVYIIDQIKFPGSGIHFVESFPVLNGNFIASTGHLWLPQPFRYFIRLNLFFRSVSFKTCCSFLKIVQCEKARLFWCITQLPPTPHPGLKIWSL